MKKTKLPGDNISLKTKKTEDVLVMQWLNTQTNLMDSLRYLIENEIVLNGVRNLQAFVPAERSVLQSSLTLPQQIEQRSLIAGKEESAAAVEDAGELQAAPASEPIAEEEIDDEDIEAWS